MKAIIGFKRYDTETAELIFHYEDSSSFGAAGVSLYRTKKGAFFIYREDEIEPVEEGQAMDWLEARAAHIRAKREVIINLIEKHFSHLLEDA